MRYARQYGLKKKVLKGDQWGLLQALHLTFVYREWEIINKMVKITLSRNIWLHTPKNPQLRKRFWYFQSEYRLFCEKIITKIGNLILGLCDRLFHRRHQVPSHLLNTLSLESRGRCLLTAALDGQDEGSEKSRDFLFHLAKLLLTEKILLRTITNNSFYIKISREMKRNKIRRLRETAELKNKV